MPKTLFNTSEKSNFILNMKPSTLNKLIIRTLTAACILIPLFGLLSELFSILNNYYSNKGNDSLAETMLTIRNAVNPSLAVIIVGVLSMIAAVIAAVKKIAGKNIMIPFIILAFSIVWCYISALNSFDYKTSLYGMYGRNEGLITQIFYYCLFFLGTLINSNASLKKFFDFLVSMGLFHCLWAFAQILGTNLQYDFKDMPVVLRKDVFLPTGFTGNPVVFAMLMSFLLAITVIGSVYDENKKRRVFYLSSAVVFAFFAVKTSTLTGIIGVCSVIVVSAVLTFKTKSFPKALGRLTIIGVSACVSMLFLFFSPSIYNTSGTFNDEKVDNGFYLYDGAIVWQDSFYNLATSGSYSKKKADFDIMNPFSVYSYMWSNSLDAIKTYPVLGSGPDCFVYTQMHESYEITQNPNSFDRPYNDYLYMAVTRGVISLAAYIFLIIFAIKKLHKPKNNPEWFKPAIISAITSYLITSFFGMSANTISPFFWIILGIACGLIFHSSQQSQDCEKTV